MPHTRSVTQLGSARERVHAMAPELEGDSPRFMAGVLLMALVDAEPRVDRLAARLGLPREFVAKCLRRFVDNGVLQDGGLVVGWAGESWSEEAFWADVNVALGLWWRRQDGSGRLEWIEAGAWHKPYEYVDRSSESSGTGYRTVAEAPPCMDLDLLTAGTDSVWIGATGGAEGAEPAPLPGTWAEEEPGDEDEADADEADAAAVVSGGDPQSAVWLF